MPAPSFWHRVLTHRLAAPLRKAGAKVLRFLPLTASARLQNGRILKVDLASSVGRSIWLRRIYEPEVKAYMDKVLKPGDAFVDVGAHVGYFSIIGSEAVGVRGEVHSFEPNGKTFELLKASIKANSLQNVRPNRVALWNEAISVSLSEGGDSGFRYVVPTSLTEGVTAVGQLPGHAF